MQPLHILLALLTTIVWGCNFIFVKLSLNDIPPLLLCTIRFFFASIPMIFFIPKPNIPFKQIIYYGLFTFAFQFGLLFVGMRSEMPTGLTALVLQIQVFLSLILAAIFLDEKPTKLQIIGAVIAFTGLGIVWSKISGSTSWGGFLFTLAGAVSWSAGNLITKKIGRVNALSLVAWGCFVSILPLFILSLILEGPHLIIHSLQHVSWISIVSMAYITYLATWFGYGMWNWLLNRYPVASIVPFTLLVPIIGMIGGCLVLDEPLESWTIMAACLIILGLSVNIFGPKLIMRFSQQSSPNEISVSPTPEEN